jgi:hypothetical protein
LVHNSAFEKRNKYIKQNCAPSWIYLQYLYEEWPHHANW